MIELTNEMVLDPHFIASDYYNKILILICANKSGEKSYGLITREKFESGEFINRCFEHLTEGNSFTSLHSSELKHLFKNCVNRNTDKLYSFKVLAFDDFLEMCIYFAES